MKDKENENENAECVKKEEMELDENGLSKNWKLFNVVMVGFAFMLIFTGRGHNTNYLFFGFNRKKFNKKKIFLEIGTTKSSLIL